MGEEGGIVHKQNCNKDEFCLNEDVINVAMEYSVKFFLNYSVTALIRSGKNSTERFLAIDYIFSQTSTI